MIGRMIITLMLPAVFATSAQGVPHAGEYGSLVQDNNKTDMASISIGSAGADSSRVYDLDEVVVVSQTKEHLLLRRQPLSSSALSGSELNAIGADGLSALSAYVPSFTMPAYGSRLTSAVYVRGIGSRVNNPAVGIYVDGIPLVSKNSYNFHVYQLDRADVLRGPQGTLYGMNTEGGLVRLFTKNPMAYQGTDIRACVGTMLQRNVEAAHYHKFNDKLGMSVAGFYNGSNGFMRNAATGRRADLSNEAGGRTRLVYLHGNGLKLDFTADYQYARQNAFPYGTLDTQNMHVSQPNTNRGNTYKRNMLNTGLGISYNRGLTTFSSQTSYQYLIDRMDMDQDYLPEDYMHLTQKQLMNALTQEFTLKGGTSDTWRHTSGVYFSYQWLKTAAPVYFDQDFTARIASGIQSAMYSAMLKAMTDRFTAMGMPQQAAESAAATAIEQAGGVSVGVDMGVPAMFRTPQANLGVFHETNLKITRRLTATLGLRYDYNRVNVSYDTGAFMSVDVNVMGTSAANTLRSSLINKTHDGYSQLLPKIGLTFDVDDNGSNVYAVVSKGYRAGGYNIQMFSDILQSELTANAQNAMAGDYDIPHSAEDYARVNKTITYKPEESWNYELGAHLNLLGNALHADISAYCMQIRNQQLSVMAGTYGFGRMMVNAGRSRSTGVETSLRGNAVDGKLDWTATYSFTHAVFTEYDETATDGSSVSYKDKRIPFVPAHTLSARADLTLPFGNNGRQAVIVGASLTAQGPTYWDEANTVSQNFYALLNIHAGVRLDKTSLRLWCRNLTDTRYATFAFSSAASGKELWFAQRGTPINAGVDIHFSF